MLRSKLGLCVIALGLMVFSASSASAAPEWLILNSKGESVNASLLPAEIVGELENKDGTLLTKLIGLKISVLCTNVTLSGLKLEGGGKLTSGGTATFTGCTVPAPSGCEVHSAGAAAGTIKTLELKKQLQTSGEVLVEPKTGTALVDLEFLGAVCSLPVAVVEQINGVLWIKDCEGKAATHLVKHLIVESTAHGHTMWIGKDTTEHLETLLDGSANVFLVGAHVGLAWGAIFP